MFVCLIIFIETMDNFLLLFRHDMHPSKMDGVKKKLEKSVGEGQKILILDWDQFFLNFLGKQKNA